MVLNIGKAYKSRFSLMKKTCIFECGDHAIVLEKEKGQVTLYATDNRCSVIYARMPLGKKLRICKDPFTVICYSQDLMLIDGKEVLLVVDFDKQKIAVNLPDYHAIGGKGWEDPNMPWQPKFNVMFGLPGGEMEMDTAAAEEFWHWFQENELDLNEQEVSRLLARVFPYENESDIEFELIADDAQKRLTVYHFRKPRLMADTETLGRMMPEALQETWSYNTGA